MEMRTIDRDDGVTEVKLVGSLDIEGANAIDIPFHGTTAAAGKPCIVDAAELDFVASLGMRMLVSCAQALQNKDTRMVMLNPQEDVAFALQTAGLDSVIPIVRSYDDALAQLGVAT